MLKLGRLDDWKIVGTKYEEQDYSDKFCGE